jgi:hypothetical protein
MKTTVYRKLLTVQKELKAPKSQYNKFGGYDYRSCEDILQAVKPLLAKAEAALTITDSLELIGERYYIKATATFVDIETGESVSIESFAREEEAKKGMDASQITGSASSYARKYALNGLFCIDDTKDADATNKHEDTLTKRSARKKELKSTSTPDNKGAALQEYYEAASNKFADSEDANNWLQLVHWKMAGQWEDDVNNIPTDAVGRALNGVRMYGPEELQKMADGYSEEYVLSVAEAM